jgi:hypothetical protein
LVGAGAVWRLFTKDSPSEPGRSVFWYYATLLAALALTLSWLPGSGFGR